MTLTLRRNPEMAMAFSAVSVRRIPLRPLGFFIICGVPGTYSLLPLCQALSPGNQALFNTSFGVLELGAGKDNFIICNGDFQALIVCWRSGPEKVRILVERSEFWLL